MNLRGLSIAILLSLSWAGPPAGATNGVEPIGVSLPARARGGVDVAVGDTALSQIDNPAALTHFSALTFDFAGQFCIPDSQWRGLVDSAASEVPLVGIGNAALAFPINERWSWGLALHSKAGLASRYSARHALIPFWDRRVGADSKMVGVLVNAAYRATDRLSLGFGVRAEADSSEFSLVLGPADLDFGRGYGFGGGFQLGALYQLRDDLTLGLAYRSPTWYGDVAGGRGQASLLGIFPIDLGGVQIENLRLPQRISAGIAWDVTPRLKLAGEVRWLDYRNSSLDSLVVHSQRPLEARLELPLQYRDEWIFAVGAEYRLDEHWTAGAGYNYATNGVGSGGLLPMGSTLAQHHITVGLRYARDNWWIGGGYIAGLAGAQHNGASDIPWGIDYGQNRLEQVQHSLIVGFGFDFGPRARGGDR